MRAAKPSSMGPCQTYSKACMEPSLRSRIMGSVYFLSCPLFSHPYSFACSLNHTNQWTNPSKHSLNAAHIIVPCGLFDHNSLFLCAKNDQTLTTSLLTLIYPKLRLRRKCFACHCLTYNRCSSPPKWYLILWKRNPNIYFAVEKTLCWSSLLCQ